ncbi:hypothetical protein AXF42_Ash003391 [Apostasia shenzhenica]|uniref:Uncharacterized protein n=1 Tax=Apostasia shenzhenica TaxID=1088818 RepID=A0A2I0BG29_9ASPA|nr:hypothetical protein AXF42_Ash003391 [Apostasia shenzhenica]
MESAKRKECFKKVKTLLPEDLQTRILDIIYEDKALSYLLMEQLITLPDKRQRKFAAFEPNIDRQIELGIVRKIIIDTHHYDEWKNFPQIVKALISTTELYERILEFEIISTFIEPYENLVYPVYQIWKLSRQQTRGRPTTKDFFGYSWDYEQKANLSELLSVYQERHQYRYIVMGES